MFVSLLTALYFACFTPVSGSVAEPLATVEWLTEQDHDFGEVRSGKTVRFKFRYKNVTAGPLILQTVRTTCGCTAAEWTEAPVGPGESGEIGIEFESSQAGPFRKKIRVFFDQQRKAEILWISGEIK